MTANPANQTFRQHAAAASRSFPESAGEFSLIALFNILLRHRLSLLLFALFAGAVSITISLVSPRLYTATGSFLPQGGQSQSSMTGLAAQLGLDVGSGNQGVSPAFYSDLAQTRQVLGAVVAAHYRVRLGGRDSVATLADFFQSPGEDWAHRRDVAIDKLSHSMSVTFDNRTSVVSVAVKSREGELSRQVVDTILAAVSQFNLERRQSQASAERKFTEGRLAEVRTDLRRAEDELQFFLQRNRILGSAELEAQRERLTREVALQQQVYSTLAQAYEHAKLEEVRDTPVITVVQSPETPLQPDSRHVFTKAVLTFLIALFLGSLITVMRDRFARHDGIPQDELRDFIELKQSALRDIRHPVKAVRRIVSRSKYPNLGPEQPVESASH